MPRGRKIKDRTGEAYGLLIVNKLHDIIPGPPKKVLWECTCQCGTKKFITSSACLSKNIKSCGCLSKNLLREMSKSRTLSKAEAGLNKVYILYKSEAKKRNLQFKLSKKKFKELIFSKCHYCNGDLSNSSTVYRPKLGNFSIKYNGIDRKDNSSGYVENNCVPCCNICNLAKRKLSYKNFIDQIIKIYNNIVVT